ncbi:dihydrofolate reductase [Kocuria sp. cx-116]|uniref:dihydrofolate reductase family protein n=1 Tax=Kocuria sp. cx-116 TaxID=2771378 RepID=UPI001681F4E9|nr:dihydrofolate reductase family protein [Kocuria sp. cx-116]MBD2763455.1 dihydrofolate reductase [Kocuria sp. cx-116]
MAHAKTWTGRIFIGVSLDGFIARTDGDIGWLTDPPPRQHNYVDSSHHAESWETFFPSVDHVVMGRGTYETVSTFDEWPYTGKRVLVLSTTMDARDNRITVVQTLDEAIVALSQGDARQVYIDGGQVIQTFLRHELVDELTVSHAPVLIGSGIPLFGCLSHDVHLTLRASHAHDGMVHNTYDVTNLVTDR